MHSVEVHILPNRVPLGRNVEHDSRSKQYAYLAPADTAVSSVSWSSSIEVLDQGSLGSCTGNAAVGCLGYEPFHSTLSGLSGPTLNLNEALAVDVYSQATKLDAIPGNYPPDDTGSSGLAVAKTLKSRGWISGYQHAFSLTATLAALQHGPVIVGTNWYESMFHPDPNGVVSVDVNSPVVGGHEYVLHGFNASNNMLGFRNSWGSDWGYHGDFYMSSATFQRLLLEKGDVTIFTPLTAPAPQPLPPNNVPDPDTLAAYKALQNWAKRNGVA